ncbi:MAG: polyribonucleotide nucleotidyltransferase [Peptococcaceae bacterium]|jgi:polyribonucleotide nucleotidyltransferase|nr:polyribonucleotide nucleotidyltransferase [Peptococcaceae bacterium]MBQ2369359.1 polyribonucleotide nucleotidyltransferase [Peptococcaceae bacterium]MBQ5368848.1 polyribonucleotide nucleotidyltransferase [Peptococcaceae bacterium]MBQ5615344.1 polyribonucleotide nucleotidyltransferase [Peptococcaceae bacterium]MBQ5658598.1 polyribonucleotide nucleotidyltransferase [Peptococcaceae bacterium]
MGNILRKSIQVGGRAMTLETGRMAKQASGAVFCTYGDTAVLVTAVGSKAPKDGVDFFPLTVDYEEKLYAAGKIPGGFLKREGKASEKAILSSRLIDRPIRPLFPKGYHNDVQVVATVLSVDMDNAPDVLAMVGASAALHLSQVPFMGPIAGVVVGLVDGEFIINPNQEQEEKSLMHLTVAGTADAVMMVEAGAKEVPEATILDAIMFGHEEIKKIVAAIEEFRTEALALELAKEKVVPELKVIPEEIEAAVKEYTYDNLLEAIRIKEKHARDAKAEEVKAEALAHLLEQFPEQEDDLRAALDGLMKYIVRRLITVDKIRPDGREMTEVRPITCEVDILPRPHGSALFTRGQTQILSTVTLGAAREEQILDGLDNESSKRYIHHYNFPPYSVGEARPMRGPGRREIGHGALAERALEPVIPSDAEFPYTIRVVSEALESNGSTSMGSVCGSTMSLMAAGVPIKRPVSGVAMGLIREENEFSVLTDLQGLEDALGDMDFKVAGTTEGVTAIQMDIKIAGINRAILEQALKQAHDGRMFILGKMLEAIPQVREELSQYAPRVITMNINPDKIRDVIGPGGKVIKKIVEDTGVKIDIEDDGRVMIMSSDAEASAKAVKAIEDIVAEVEVGRTYMGKVVRITDFGAFVEVLPGKDGLVHISQLALERVKKVEDVVKIGDEIMVKCIEIDEKGRVNLSRKVLLNKEEN